MPNYANTNAVVSTEWVSEHKNDANLVVVEVDVDTSAYDDGHMPGALGWSLFDPSFKPGHQDQIVDMVKPAITCGGVAAWNVVLSASVAFVRLWPIQILP